MRGLSPHFFLAWAFLLACTSHVTLQVDLPPGQVQDAFVQQSLVKADILWVVDDSGSMAREQCQLANAFPQFFKWLQGAKVDYRIGITTSDLGSKSGDLGNDGNFLGDVIVGNSQDPGVPNTADPQMAFAQTILVGTNGSPHDQSQEAARLALVRQAQNANQAIANNQSVLFLRPDAALFIIFVSDGFDYSPGDYEYYWRAYHQAKGIGNDNLILVSAIAGDYPGGCDVHAGTYGNCTVPADGHIDPGIHLYQLVTRSSGVFGSICDTQFDQTLDQIGIQAVGLQHRFRLSNPPDPKSIVVEVHYPCSTDPNVDPHLANCTNPPGITVQCPSGAGSACTASCDQVTDAALIVCVAPESDVSGWSYEAADQTIVFNGASATPGLGSVVKVTYNIAGYTN